MTNSQPWKRAGILSKTMSEQAMNLFQSLAPPLQVYVLDLPDNIQGAYVFRNGFSASLDLLGKPDDLAIIELKKIHKGQLKESDMYTVLAWENERFCLYKAPGRRLMLQAKE